MFVNTGVYKNQGLPVRQLVQGWGSEWILPEPGFESRDKERIRIMIPPWKTNRIRPSKKPGSGSDHRKNKPDPDPS